MITRKLAGTFPNYEMVIPRDNDKKAIFDVDEMRAAVRRVSLMADERARSIKFIVKEGEVEIVAQNSDDGEGQERVAADYSGPEVTIGFNSQYLQDFLSVAAGAFEESSNEDGEGKKTISKARVSFEFKDGNSQTQMSVSGSNEYDYKYIVMPLRI